MKSKIERVFSGVLALLLSVGSFFGSSELKAEAAGISSDNIVSASSATIPAEYSESFRVIEDEDFDMTYGPEEVWAKTTKNNSNNIDSINISSYKYMVKHKYLNSKKKWNTYKGTIWWQYNDVAYYQGHHIDIRCTLMDWDYTFVVPSTGKDVGESSIRYQLYARTEGYIGAGMMYGSQVKVSFYDHDTGEEISIKGNMTAVDIDGAYSKQIINGEVEDAGYDVPAEQFVVDSGIDYIYYGSGLKKITNGIQGKDETNGIDYTTSADEDRWATILFNGSSFTFTYETGAFVGFTNYPTTLVVPSISKAVDKTTAHMGDTVTYTVTASAPIEPDSSTFTSYVITDTIPNSLNFSESDISVKDSTGADATSKFTITKDGQKITLTAKDPGAYEFQALNYIITVKTTVTTDTATLSGDTTSDGTILKNTATLTYQLKTDTASSSLTSNEVQTEVLYELYRKGTNASLTLNGGDSTTEKTNSDIPGGSTQTVVWEPDNGYYMTSVVIDGESQEIGEDDLYGGSYTFDDYVGNHSVVVVAQKIDYNLTKTTVGETFNYKDEVEFTLEIENPNEDGVSKNVVIKDVKIEDEDGNDVTDKLVIDMDSVTISGNSCEDPVLEADGNGFKYTLSTMAKGEVVTISFKAKITDESLCGHTLTNTAVLTADNYVDSDGTPIELTDTSTVTVLKPEITVNKMTDQDRYYNVGDDVDYKVIVSQTTADAVAYNLVVTDAMQRAGVTIDYDSIKVYAGDYTNTTEYPEDQLLADGTDYTLTNTTDSETGINGYTIEMETFSDAITIVYTAKIESEDLVGTTVVNKVTAKTDNGDPVEDEEEVPVKAPNLTIDKILNEDETQFNVGDTVNYQVVVKQTEEGARANDVVVTDTLEQTGMTIDEDSIKVYKVDISADGAELTDSDLLENGTDYEVSVTDSGLTLKMDSLGYQASGDGFYAITIIYSATITESDAAGTIQKNVVKVSSSNVPDEPEDEVEIEVLEPVLDITKYITSSDYNVKDVVDFVIEVTQTVENAKANDVVLTDNMLTDGLDIDFDSLILVKSSAATEAVTGNAVSTGTSEDTSDETDSTDETESDTTSDESTDESTSEDSESSDDATLETASVDVADDSETTDETEESTEDTSDDTEESADEESEDTSDDESEDTTTEGTTTDSTKICPYSSIDELTDYGDLLVEGEDYTVEETDDGWQIVLADQLLYGETVYVGYRATITDPALAGEEFTNQVTATWSNSPSNPDGVTDEDTSNVLKPVLEIEKSIDQEEYSVGDTAYYTVVVRQITEGARANDLEVTDSLDTDDVEIDTDSFEVYDANDEKLSSDDYKISATSSGYTLTMDSLTDQITIKYTAKIGSGAAGKTFNNVAVASSSNVDKPVQDDATAKVKSNPNTTVQTGDNGTMLLIVAGIVIVAAGLYLIFSKRKKSGKRSDESNEE